MANRNYQLVLIRIIVTLINIVGLFVFLGVPVIVAMLSLGLDLAQAKDILPFFRQDPLEFASKYLGLIFLAVISFIFYLLFASMLFLYSLSGTLGVLKNSVVNISYKFSLASFLKEANSGFSRLFRLVSLVFLVMTVVFMVFGVVGGIAAGITQVVVDAQGALEMFLSSFAALTILVFSAIIILTFFIFIVYSIIVTVSEETGVMESVRRTFDFLRQRPQALLFFIILAAGFVTANAVLFSLQILLSAIPFMLPLFFLINVFLRNYLAIFLWSSLIVYYLRSTNYPVHYAGYEI